MNSHSLLLLLMCALILSCQKETSAPKQHVNVLRSNVSPLSVNIGGIRLLATSNEVKSQFSSFKCRKEEEKERCVHTVSRQERKTTLRGMDKLSLTFVSDRLESISISYPQMFDMEYESLKQSILDRFGAKSSQISTDSIQVEWISDSLRIVLVPNRKPHWTGSFFTYTPIVEYAVRPPSR